jgi:Ca2+-binding EF-hand superfamily protein
MYNAKEILEKNQLFDYVSKLTFDAVDEDNSGLISKDEMFSILNSISADLDMPPISKFESDEIMQKLDDNGNDTLDYKEFKSLFRKLMNIIVRLNISK